MVQSGRLFMASKHPQTQTWPFTGHAELGRRLIHLLQTKQLPGVSLFVGPRSVGKASAAKWLLQYSLCTAQNNQPCGNCPACRQSIGNSHPNGVMLDSSSGSSIGIDDIRLAIKPYELVSWNQAPRWFIIADAERLTEAAATMMLKFLEEIPPHLQVILTSSEPERLPPTLRSRATVYQWHLVRPDELSDVPGAQHDRVARAVGRPGWMELLSDQRAAAADVDEAISMAEQFLQPGMSSAQRLPKERVAVEQIINREELVIRELLLRSVGSRRRLLWPIDSFSNQLSPQAAMTVATKYLDRYDLSANVQPRLLYEDLHLV